MTTHPIRRTGALALAVAVAATTAVAGLAAPAAAAPAGWQSNVDVAPDYLVDTYGLPADHVFETVTFERFEWLLNGKYDDNATNVTGRFAFLVGGAYDPSITSTIGYIDQVAKQYGVDTIYQFDPALDGSTYNVWNTSALTLAPTGKAAIEALGNRLIDNYLNKDTAPAFTKASTDPYLFIYDKSHTVDVGGVPTEDRIVASLNVRKTAADFAVPGAVDAYKAQVAAVFAAASVGGVAQLDELDQFTFFKGEVNRRHKLGYPTAATNGGNILDDADDTDDWRVQSITYAELKHLLQQDGDYVILFGGTWCHNTRAVLKQINREAQENGVEKVYIFDNSLDSTGNGGSNYLHIRDNPAPTGTPALPQRASYLYGDLWNTYLTNVKTQYKTSVAETWTGSVNPVQFYPGGDTTQPVQLARKGQVPFLLEYNKANISEGTAAPVVSQWIRANASGWTEYMTEWWLTPTGGNLSGTPTAQAFGAEAEAALETFFDELPGVAAATPETPAAPTASVTGTSVTVTWAAPADGGSAITGFKVSLDGGTPVAVGADVTSHTFTGVAAGSHTATVVATNAVGDSSASAASNPVTVVAAEEPEEPEEPVDPSTVKGTVTVTGDLKAGGTITVRGTGFAESTSGFAVEVHSTPQLLGTVGTDAAGAFTLTATLPANLPAGSHSIVVLYDGVTVSSAAVSVAAAPALAATGADVASLVSLTATGLATLVLGGLVAAGVGITRRRQAA